MDEFVFRLSVAFVFVVSAVGAAWFRSRAQRSAERLDRSTESNATFWSIRIAGGLLAIATLVAIATPGLMQWGRMGLPTSIRAAGLPVAALGLALMFWTLSNLGKSYTDTVSLWSDHQLVVTGPYRWIRHPYYSAMLLLVLGVSLLQDQTPVLVLGLILFGLLAIRSADEEAMLVKRFGASYLELQKQTGRFVPRISLSTKTHGASRSKDQEDSSCR